MIAKTDTQHYSDIADAVRYSLDGTQYESSLAQARAEIAENNELFEDISEAIQSKTGQAEPYDKDELASTISSEWVISLEEKDVNFYDYDGTVLYAYTAEEALALSALPEAPTHGGLTFQGWNWTLIDIKTWIAGHEAEQLGVGALYVTDNGHTRIYMTLRAAEMSDIEMPFCIHQIEGIAVIDWGDGSTPDTITAAGIYSHLWQIQSYPTNIVIDIEYTPSASTKLVLGYAVGSTTYGLFNNEVYYASCVNEVKFGSNVDMLQYSATFKNCSNLTSINIPKSVMRIGTGEFAYCAGLASITISDTATSIGSYGFYNCRGLTSIAIPDSVRYIGTYAFYSCSSLTSILIPDSVTSIGNYAFYHCWRLTSVTIPDSVTSIGNSAFYGCTGLTNVQIPDSVTSIGEGVFDGCTGLYYLDLSSYTDSQNLPTLANTNALQNTPTSQKIYVYNQEMLDAFSTATNWSTYASRFQIKPSKE